MKRAMSMVLVLLMVISLAACGAAGQAAPAASVAATDEGWNAGSVGYDVVESTPAIDDWAGAYNGESYSEEAESPFKSVADFPLSTFSSDVDTASYSNMRRFISNGQQPQGVRIEELVNYFSYDYPAPDPAAEHPFTVSAEIATCPWNEEHLLAMVGVQAAQLANSGDIANNIVFLLDVSGSMNAANKLPLLQESFKLLIDELGEHDVISIVTYAGSDTIAADSVPGSQHQRLAALIDDLSAGGSTAGARGLHTRL